MPSDDSVLDAEALLRASLGELLTRALGATWQSHLSRGVRKQLDGAREVARRNRQGVPNDPWQSAGLKEIEQVSIFFLREIHENGTDYSSTDPDELLASGLEDLGWTDVSMCKADFSRMTVLRHDEAHPDVAPPFASVVVDEALLIAKRLQLGCEKIRRRLMEEDEEWFPYISRVTCPGVREWEYRRGQIGPGMASLHEGDELEFAISAVNTDGTESNLRYGLFVQGDGGSFVTIADNEQENRIRCNATPPGRNVVFRVTVRSLSGGHDASGWDDEVLLAARIRPAE